MGPRNDGSVYGGCDAMRAIRIFARFVLVLVSPHPAPTLAAETSEPSAFAPQPVAAQHLPNAWWIHPRVLSGGLPAGDAAFQQLAELGVKTIISVDGARPDVAAAEKHGLRYVHLPHGYNGISAERALELAKAMRDLPGPIYVHCHHGKHRSPAAAAVGCVGAGLIAPAAAEPFLKAAGTSESYRGLYAAAREAQPFDPERLAALQAEFPATAQLPPLAEKMVALDETYERVTKIAAVGWKSPADHPDLDPPHEALLLREHFTELLRDENLRRRPDDFAALLRESETAARALESALATWRGEASAAPPLATLQDALGKITADCKSCHTAHRDVPLGGPDP